MPDPREIAERVERVVSEVFDQRVAELRAQVVKRVVEEIAPLLSEGTPPTAVLESSVAAMEDGSTQADILRALLDGAAHFSGRVALFVVRGNAATGWQARGFEENDGIKNFSLDAGQGLIARVLQDRTPTTAAAADFDSGFIASVGNPSDGNALLVPLLVREKTPAVIYADSGTQGAKLDRCGVQLLVRAAGRWLELLAARKAGAASATEKAEADAEKAESEPAEEAPAPPPTPSMEEVPPEHEEVHKKARKFAKLLVDELKLYNQGKVAEGRAHKDLYDRLKDDIDKSRAAYEKRYGSTPAASGDYFRQAVIRILADNDESVLGNSFPR